MSARERFAKRKSLDLQPVTLVTSIDQVDSSLIAQEPLRADQLTSAIDQILEARGQQRVVARLDESKMVLLRSVAVPFGLGHIVAASSRVGDREGGDVHTVHNVRNDVYATDERRQQYVDRGAYDKAAADKCHQTPNYKRINEIAGQQQDAGTLRDAYTDRIIPRGKGVLNLDHVVASKTVHDDAGRVLAGLSADALSTKAENLAPTHHSINQSKKALSAEEYLIWLDNRAPQRKLDIERLASKESRTFDEEGELTKLREQDSVDAKLLRERGDRAKEAIDRDINKAWYTSQTFAYEAISSTARSTAKGGITAAFGEFLIEFLAAAWDEAKDWYLHRDKSVSAFEDLKARLQRIAERVASRKEAAMEAFVSGSIGGFIAAIISILINSIKTTQKRVARMLREGAQSLVRVVSMLAAPAGGMSTRECVYAATHIVVSTTMIVGGIALEELLADAIKTHLPMVAFIADPVAVVVSGVVAGLCVVLSASLIDRWDPFGVIEEQDLRHVISDLDSQIDAACADVGILLPSPA